MYFNFYVIIGRDGNTVSQVQSVVHSVHPPPYLSGSSAVYRFLWLPLVENISPPAAPSATPGEASCPGFAQPGCDLMPKPFLSPAGCSGSETKACNATGIITLNTCLCRSTTFSKTQQSSLKERTMDWLGGRMSADSPRVEYRVISKALLQPQRLTQEPRVCWKRAGVSILENNCSK